MAENGYVRCIDGFMLHDRTIVKGGQVLAANDRAVKGREHLFKPLDDDEAIAAATVPVGERLIGAGREDKVIATAQPVKKASKKAAG